MTKEITEIWSFDMTFLNLPQAPQAHGFSTFPHWCPCEKGALQFLQFSPLAGDVELSTSVIWLLDDGASWDGRCFILLC